MILIYIVCKDKKEAEKIGLKFLRDRLIACYNLWSMDSAYFWKGKITKDKEAVLLLKTNKKNYSKIRILVKKMHSYETPCIFSLKPDKIDRSYINWLIKSIKYGFS